MSHSLSPGEFMRSDIRAPNPALRRATAGLPRFPVTKDLPMSE